MRIPEVREEMLFWADIVAGSGWLSLAEKLREWERELHRKPYVRKIKRGFR